MNEIESSPDDFANAFESAFARLRVAVEETCAREAEWPAKIATAIDAALAFAAADPAAARTLTLALPTPVFDDGHRYLRLIEHFAELLRAAAPHDRRHPPSTELALVGGLATLIREELRAGRAERLRALHPDLVEFTLLPYLGAAQAAAWARRSRLAPRPPHLAELGDPELLRRIEFTEVLSRLQAMIGEDVQVVASLVGGFFDCGFTTGLERVETLSGGEGPVLVVFGKAQGIALDPAELEAFVGCWPGRQGLPWIELHIARHLRLVIEPLGEPRPD